MAKVGHFQNESFRHEPAPIEFVPDEKTVRDPAVRRVHGGKADGAGERASSAKTPADLRKFNKGFKKYVQITKEGVQTAGREIKDMPAWGGVIDDKTILNIGAYLETLAMEGANWKEGVKN